MILVDMATGESRTAQFNPAELNETISVNYTKIVVPGLSHTRKHYINTDDVKYDFELFAHCLDGSGPDGLNAIQEDRRFLYSLTHPRGAQSIREGGPPRVLFIWPKLISLTCVVTGLAFNYTMFNAWGAPVAWKAKVTLEQIRDAFVSSAEIREIDTYHVEYDILDSLKQRGSDSE